MGVFGQSEFVSIENLNFRIYTDEEVKKLSVMRVINPESFNNLGHIASNGIYDLRMGPINYDEDLCETCHLRYQECAGHCGHIELPLPVYNPLFYDVIRKILPHVCFNCYRFIAKQEMVLQIVYQLKLLSKGYITEALELEDFVSQLVSNFDVIEPEVTGTKSTGTEEDTEKITKKINGEALGKDSTLHRHIAAKLELHVSSIFRKGSSQEVCNSNKNAVWGEIWKKFWIENKGHKHCPFCDKRLLKLVLQYSRFMIKSVASKDMKDKGEAEKLRDSQSFLTPKQIQTALRKCWDNDGLILSSLYPILSKVELEYPTDIFFLNTLLVIPPRFRPYVKQFGTLMSEHESAPLLKNIIKFSMYLVPLLTQINGTLKDMPKAFEKTFGEIEGATAEEKCQSMWYQIQTSVDNLCDANLIPSKKVTGKGIRQVIEKKEGLMRHNLMGKRVNFSARSVAAPDPHLAVDEVGVPQDFALKLSYPVPVTEWNVEEMRKLVMNGPKKYPGAIYVEDEEGRKMYLHKLNETERSAIAKKLLTPVESHFKKVNAQKIVHRQLKNGDFVLMNRQPTLHRPSIQAHRARVMPKDRVLRMPYSNCKAYNADFDGDEFNMHFPQSELARSEAKHLITTHNQYLTPKDGSPLAGLIQDCVVSSVKITMRGKFFSREDYHQIVYASLPDQTGRIVCLPPCIVKPQQLWSGKQVISTLINNVIPAGKAKPSFTFKTSVKPDIWQTEKARQWQSGGLPEARREAMTESEFVMSDGDLLSGVVDKSAIGSTSHGLIHVCYELYGGAVAYKLLTAINRLCVYYLQWVGHTITVKDFLTSKHVSRKRRRALQDLIKRAPDEVKAKLDIDEGDLQDYFESAHMSGNVGNMAALDAAYTSVLGPTTSRVTGENEGQLLRPGLDNQMKMMVDTGAKGSRVNMNQMASLFGSVAVDGKRMPLNINGKSLPSFKSYDLNPCSGGYIPNRFMTGINPKSYFFLCIVGRDSLQHTAVKTANSGYVQRCLIKHLEGIRVDYDHTVRNSDGLVLQFNYGEDGLDVTKVPFMASPSTMDVLVTNYSRLIDDRSLAAAQSVSDQEQIKTLVKKFKGKHKPLSDKLKRKSGFLRFCKKLEDQVHLKGFHENIGRSEYAMHLQRLWFSLTGAERQKYREKVKRLPDPIDSVLSSAANLGVVSEALDKMIDDYYTDYYVRRQTAQRNLSRDEIERTIHMKALMSKVDPGEAVGALCAQALGEPLTQMTLNTFHFAGKDELNVTLGVPRMIEILRTGSETISTPIMEVPFYPHVKKQQAEKVKMLLSEVSLSKILLKMSVVSRNVRGRAGVLQRVLKIRFDFLPHKDYKHQYAVTPHEVLKHVEKNFLPKILKEILTAIKKHKIQCFTEEDKKEGEKMKSAKVINDDDGGQVNMKVMSDGSDSEDDNDGDAKAERSKQNDYSGDEEEAAKSSAEASEDEEQVEENDSQEETEIYEGNHSKKRKRKDYSVTAEAAALRIELVVKMGNSIQNYDFDRKAQLWCEVEYVLPLCDGAYDVVSIVRELSERSLIRNVSGIRRVFVVEKDGTLMLRTEGVNVLQLYAYENFLNVNKLYTNNIHQVAKMYGIEAAQRSIIREIRAVLSAYDIKINFRHLSLLADYFTCEGMYKACSRGSITTCSSPIQKMSFETCFQFLKHALLQVENEKMDSPSSNIAVGQPPKVGTNSMHIRHVYSNVRL